MCSKSFAHIFDVEIELFNGPYKVVSVDKNCLFIFEQFCQVIHDEEDTLVLVGTHHDVGLLEVFRFQRLLWGLIKERTINDGHERELGTAEHNAVPFTIDKLMGVFRAQALNCSTNIFPV